MDTITWGHGEHITGTPFRTVVTQAQTHAQLVAFAVDMPPGFHVDPHPQRRRAGTRRCQRRPDVPCWRGAFQGRRRWHRVPSSRDRTRTVEPHRRNRSDDRPLHPLRDRGPVRAQRIRHEGATPRAVIEVSDANPHTPLVRIFPAGDVASAEPLHHVSDLTLTDRGADGARPGHRCGHRPFGTIRHDRAAWSLPRSTNHHFQW